MSIEHDGDRYARSPLTGNYYRVTEWEDLGDGKIKSMQKFQVARQDVPDEVLEKLDGDAE